MIKNVLVFALTLAALSFNAHADERFVGARKFAELMDQYQMACAPTCQKPFREALLFVAGKKMSPLLTDGQLQALQKIANEQAYIWADTILEGDYYATGETKLEEVTGIFKGSTLVGYKIRYSEMAWETGSCDFDYEDLSSLATCIQGIIRETSFVSPDLKTYIRNHNDIADFYNN